jgi:hypothetical protein
MEQPLSRPVSVPHQANPLDKLRQSVTHLRQIVGDTQSNPAYSALSTSSSCSSLQSLDAVPLDAAHWLEVADARHRYGTALRPYYAAWAARNERDRAADTSNFFRFLDGPDGRDLDLEEHENCSQECRYRRHVLDAQHLKKRSVSRKVLEESVLDYCDVTRRRQYMVTVRDGRLVWVCDGAHWDAGERVHTGTCDKWIFVMALDGTLYVNRKVKGRFHHSCFLAGGRVLAAGRLIVLDGRVEFLAAQSGHYKPNPRCVDVVAEVLGSRGLAGVNDIRISDNVHEEC